MCEQYKVTGSLDGEVSLTCNPALAVETAQEYATGYMGGPEVGEIMKTLQNFGRVRVQGHEVHASVERVTGPGRPVWFKFDGDESGRMFPGVDTGTRWNGWLNPRVSPKIRERVAAAVEDLDPCEEAREQAAEIMSLPADPDGFVDLSGLGFMFEEVTG